MLVQTAPVTRQKPVGEYVRVIGRRGYHRQDFAIANIHDDDRTDSGGVILPMLSRSIFSPEARWSFRSRLPAMARCTSAVAMSTGSDWPRANLGHMLLQPDIKRQLHIPARFRLEITEHPIGRPRAFTSTRSPPGVPRSSGSSAYSIPILPVARSGKSPRAVLLNLPACQGRHIAGDMAGQRALRINPAQRLLEGHTRKICRADGRVESSRWVRLSRIRMGLNDGPLRACSRTRPMTSSFNSISEASCASDLSTSPHRAA